MDIGMRISPKEWKVPERVLIKSVEVPNIGVSSLNLGSKEFINDMLIRLLEEPVSKMIEVVIEFT